MSKNARRVCVELKGCANHQIVWLRFIQLQNAQSHCNKKNIKLIRLLKGALCTWTIHLHLHNMLHSVQARAVCVSIFRISCLWRKIKLSWNEGLTRRTIWKASHISGICFKSRKSTHEQHWKWDFKEYWKVCYNRRISSLLTVGNSMMLPSDVGAASDLCPCIGVLWRTVKLTQAKPSPKHQLLVLVIFVFLLMMKSCPAPPPLFTSYGQFLLKGYKLVQSYFPKVKMIQMRGFQDGSARFHTWNLSTPALSSG